MRRVLGLVAVILVAGLVAWFALRDEATRSSDERSATIVPAVDEAARAPPRKRTRAGEPETAAKSAPEVAPAPDATPPAAKPETIAAEDSSGTLLAKGPDGPLADVRVGFLAFHESTPPGFEKDADHEGTVAAVLAHGRLLATGSDGRTALPKFSKSAVVAARHNGLVGMARLKAGGKDWTLELGRAVAIDAVVRDATGRPCADVGVLLVCEWDNDSYVLRSVRTGAAGRARMADLEERDVDADERLVLTVAVPLAPPPRVTIDLASPPTEPVTLTLPATGRLRCEVVDEGGRPGPDGQVMLLPLVPAEGADADREELDDDDDRVAWASVNGGVAMFPRVGVGTEFEAELRPSDGTHATVRQRVQGPKAAGEEAVARLVLGGARPVLVGRLLGPSGAPIPGAVLVAYVVEPGQVDWGARGRGERCTTDAEGRFRLTLDSDADPPPGAKVRLVRDIIDPGAPTRSLALLDLPPRAASEERMVGDVTDRGAALLVAGVVEDASGKPLQGAAVEVREVRQRGQSRVADTDDVTTDAEGRFSVEGATGESKLTVHVSLEGWYLAELPMFAPGRDDLRVTLAPAGGIAGSVRTPEGAAPLRVEIFVSGEPSRNGGTGYEASDGLSTWVQKDGSFSFPSLRPGKAKVSVRHGWSDRDTVAVVEDVEVVAGQVTRDPRLQGLDLAKSLRAIRVSAVDPDGRPVAGATAHWRATGEDTYWREVTSGKDGVATIHVKPRDGRPARIDVIVKRSGHRSAALSGIETDVQATLRPWKPVLVRIRLADATAVPEPPFHIVPELAWTEPGAEKEDDDWADMDPRGVDDDVSFGKDRVVTLSVPEPGRYRVTLVLWETGPGGGGGSSLATSPERVVVDVPEHASGPIEVVVAADPEEFAEETKRRTER